MYRPTLTTDCLDRAVDVCGDAVGVHDVFTARETIVEPDAGDSGARPTGRLVAPYADAAIGVAVRFSGRPPDDADLKLTRDHGTE
jgi:hypothetical protein